MRVPLAFAGSSLAGPTPEAHAQTQTAGKIIGQALDPSKAAISNVAVAATNSETVASAGRDQFTDNYMTTQALDLREDTASIRLDQVLSTHDSAFARVNVNDSDAHGPLFSVSPSSLGVDDHQIVPVRTTNVAIHEEHVFSGSVVNDFLGGMQRWASQEDQAEPLPLTTGVGYSGIPGTWGKSRGNNTSFQFGDTMSKVKGRHVLTWGGIVYRTPGFGEIFNTLGRTLGAGTSRQIQFALTFSF